MSKLRLLVLLFVVGCSYDKHGMSDPGIMERNAHYSDMKIIMDKLDKIENKIDKLGDKK